MQKKAFDKTQHPSLIKTFQSVGIERTFFNFIKTIYEKPMANIILNGEKLKASLKIRNMTRMPTLTIIQHSTRSPCNSNQKTKRDKKYPNRGAPGWHSG